MLLEDFTPFSWETYSAQWSNSVAFLVNILLLIYLRSLQARSTQRGPHCCSACLRNNRCCSFLRPRNHLIVIKLPLTWNKRGILNGPTLWDPTYSSLHTNTIGGYWTAGVGWAWKFVWYHYALLVQNRGSSTNAYRNSGITNFTKFQLSEWVLAQAWSNCWLKQSASSSHLSWTPDSKSWYQI